MTKPSIILAITIIPIALSTIVLRSTIAPCPHVAGQSCDSTQAATRRGTDAPIPEPSGATTGHAVTSCSMGNELTLSVQSTDLPADGGVAELTFRAKSSIDIWAPQLAVRLPKGASVLDQHSDGGVTFQLRSADGAPIEPLLPRGAAAGEDSSRIRVLAAGADASGTLQVQFPTGSKSRMVYLELLGSTLPTSASPGLPIHSDAVVLYATEKEVGLPPVVFEGSVSSRDIPASNF